jgi:hypothetical protein
MTCQQLNYNVNTQLVLFSLLFLFLFYIYFLPFRMFVWCSPCSKWLRMSCLVEDSDFLAYIWPSFVQYTLMSWLNLSSASSLTRFVLKVLRFFVMKILSGTDNLILNVCNQKLKLGIQKEDISRSHVIGKVHNGKSGYLQNPRESIQC